MRVQLPNPLLLHSKPLSIKHKRLFWKSFLGKSSEILKISSEFLLTLPVFPDFSDQITHAWFFFFKISKMQSRKCEGLEGWYLTNILYSKVERIGKISDLKLSIFLRSHFYLCEKCSLRCHFRPWKSEKKFNKGVRGAHATPDEIFNFLMK